MTGEELQHIRDSKGLSQKAFGALFGASAANVSRWEKGIHDVPTWVTTELLRTVKIPLPIEDLHSLVEYARRENQPLETILADAIRSYLAPSKAEVSTKIVHYQSDTDNNISDDSKVAEDSKNC